jgi:hypothetical protein
MHSLPPNPKLRTRSVSRCTMLSCGAGAQTWPDRAVFTRHGDNPVYISHSDVIFSSSSSPNAPSTSKMRGKGADRAAYGCNIPATLQHPAGRCLSPNRSLQRRRVAVFATARQLARLIYRMLRYGQTMSTSVGTPTSNGSKSVASQQSRKLPRTSASSATLPLRKFQVSSTGLVEQRGI